MRNFGFAVVVSACLAQLARKGLNTSDCRPLIKMDDKFDIPFGRANEHESFNETICADIHTSHPNAPVCCSVVGTETFRMANASRYTSYSDCCYQLDQSQPDEVFTYITNIYAIAIPLMNLAGLIFLILFPITGDRLQALYARQEAYVESNRKIVPQKSQIRPDARRPKMMCCTIFGLLLVIVGAVVPIILENRTEDKLKSKANDPIDPDSYNFRSAFFEENEATKIDAYFYDIENLDEHMGGAKLVLQEKGPYRYYVDFTEKMEISFDATAGTVSYYTYSRYRFTQNGSCEGCLEKDSVTTYNSPAIKAFLLLADMFSRDFGLDTAENMVPMLLTDAILPTVCPMQCLLAGKNMQPLVPIFAKTVNILVQAELRHLCCTSALVTGSGTGEQLQQMATMCSSITCKTIAREEELFQATISGTNTDSFTTYMAPYQLCNFEAFGMTNPFSIPPLSNLPYVPRSDWSSLDDLQKVSTIHKFAPQVSAGSTATKDGASCTDDPDGSVAAKGQMCSKDGIAIFSCNDRLLDQTPVAEVCPLSCGRCPKQRTLQGGTDPKASFSFSITLSGVDEQGLVGSEAMQRSLNQGYSKLQNQSLDYVVEITRIGSTAVDSSPLSRTPPAIAAECKDDPDGSVAAKGRKCSSTGIATFKCGALLPSGEAVDKQCPLSCGKCSAVDSSPLSRTPPAIAAECKDDPDGSVAAKGRKCSSTGIATFKCGALLPSGEAVDKQCPLSCGKCSPITRQLVTQGISLEVVMKITTANAATAESMMAKHNLIEVAEIAEAVSAEADELGIQAVFSVTSVSKSTEVEVASGNNDSTSSLMDSIIKASLQIKDIANTCQSQGAGVLAEVACRDGPTHVEKCELLMEDMAAHPFTAIPLKPLPNWEVAKISVLFSKRTVRELARGYYSGVAALIRSIKERTNMRHYQEHVSKQSLCRSTDSTIDSSAIEKDCMAEDAYLVFRDMSDATVTACKDIGALANPFVERMCRKQTTGFKCQPHETYSSFIYCFSQIPGQVTGQHSTDYYPTKASFESANARVYPVVGFLKMPQKKTVLVGTGSDPKYNAKGDWVEFDDLSETPVWDPNRQMHPESGAPTYTYLAKDILQCGKSDKHGYFVQEKGCSAALAEYGGARTTVLSPLPAQTYPVNGKGGDKMFFVPAGRSALGQKLGPLQQSFSVFITNIRRSLTFEFDRAVQHGDVHANRFFITPGQFNASTRCRADQQGCDGAGIPSDGVISTGPLGYKLPLYFMQAFFREADAKLFRHIVLKRAGGEQILIPPALDDEDFQSYIDVEPATGAPINFRLDFGGALAIPGTLATAPQRSIFDSPLFYKDVFMPEVIVPIFRRRIIFTSKKVADGVQTAKNMLKLAKAFRIAFLLVGILIIVVALGRLCSIPRTNEVHHVPRQDVQAELELTARGGVRNTIMELAQCPSASKSELASSASKQ